jgi:hypothetical protein
VLRFSQWGQALIDDDNAIITDDVDRQLFLDTLAQMSRRFEVDIFAYVLMDNIIIFCVGPIERICPKACNGLGPLTPIDSMFGTTDPVIYSRDALKTCWLKMMPAFYGFRITLTAIL